MTRRVKTHIRLGIRSVSPSDQSPHCPHEETLGPNLPNLKFLREISRSVSAKCRGVSPQTFAEFLRDISRRKPLAKQMIFIFLREKNISRKGCTAAKREKKKAFFLG